MKSKSETRKTRRKKILDDLDYDKTNLTTFATDNEEKAMKLKFIPPPKVAPSFTANVHSTGKIGFTLAGAKYFGITTSKLMQFAVNEEDPNDQNIYGVLVDAEEGIEGYKIMKGGDYHSVNAKAFFEAMKIDFTRRRPSYIVTDFEVDGTKMMKFTKKELIQPNGQK